MVYDFLTLLQYELICGLCVKRAYFQMFLHEFLLGVLGPSVLELVICFIEVRNYGIPVMEFND